MNTAQTLCLAMMLTGLLVEASYGICDDEIPEHNAIIDMGNVAREEELE
ncbi:hypothetical protein LJR267_010181 [Paraburkholderia hospita]